MKEYWVSSKIMTMGVTVDEEGIIREAAPIVRVFVGQPFDNLIVWMQRQGGFKYERILGG